MQFAVRVGWMVATGVPEPPDVACPCALTLTLPDVVLGTVPALVVNTKPVLLPPEQFPAALLQAPIGPAPLMSSNPFVNVMPETANDQLAPKLACAKVTLC